MTIRPETAEVRDYLTLKHRKMVRKGRKTVTEHYEDPMYKLSSQDGQAVLQSYQGFWKCTAEYLEKRGNTVTIHDVRPKILPEPNYDAAMRHLMDYQKPWIREALESGESGLLGAPTRFGKSYGMTAIAEAFPEATIVVTAPGVDLCEQLYEHFKKVLPRRKVHGIYSGGPNRVQSDDITICSIDSLHKMDPGMTDILMVDEPHAIVSDTRLPKIAAFTRSRKYGFGATLKGRYDKKDRLIEGLIGPIIANVTYLEAVEMNAIAPMKVAIVKIPFSKDTLPGKYLDRDVVYDRLLLRSLRTAKLVGKIAQEIIPNDWQVMSFIADEKQAEFYLENAMPAEGTIAMAKRLKKKERKELTKAIADGEIWRVLASNIYVQGLTFPDLKVVLNLAGGGANTTAIQKPGRLLQKRPGKKYGVMFDFIFECHDQHLEARKNPPYNGIVREGWARYNCYKEIGYDIEFVENADHARKIVLESYDYE